MPTLYVTEIGARVEKEYGRLLVTSKDDQVLLAVPIWQVSEVVLVGAVGVTTPAMLALLEVGVGLTLVSRSGRLRGRLQPAEQRNLPLRRRQYACSQDEHFCLEISRRIADAKLRNSRTLLRRILRQRRNRQSPALLSAGNLSALKISALLGKVALAESTAELRGYEGQAARSYFHALRLALRQDLGLQGRSRRPPKDPANALLSLAYSLLTQCCFTACQVAGLDAYDGFFHADKYGRPALALDLVEEFRAVVADSLLLTLVNNLMLAEQDFEFQPAEEQYGVVLTRRGLKIFLEQFARRIQTPVFHPVAGRALSYQKIFEIQARQLRKAIETGQPDYRPFLAK